MPNRRFFYDWLQYALDQAKRENQIAAILFINLDGFKAVNSFFGYERGNKLLQVVAARLKEATRAGDVIARIGGDEFAVLIPILTDPADPAGLAQRLVEAMALPFKENESLAIRRNACSPPPTRPCTVPRPPAAADTLSSWTPKAACKAGNCVSGRICSNASNKTS
jgi:diguanylate cyclase (GGDEF)-like protein